MIKKFFTSLIITTIALSTVALTAFTPVYAATDSGSTGDTGTTGNGTGKSSSFKGRTGDNCQIFLGLTTWDCGVDIKDQDSLKAGVWTIAANILTDIFVIAAYLIIGYVMYGGYQYMFSGGDPGKVANGKKTLTHAFIGLAIVMSANAIMSSIRIALVGGNGNMGNCLTEQCVDPNDMVVNLIQWFIAMGGVVAVVFMIYGGIAYATSSGDTGKLQKAKQTIIYALIGLTIVILAEIITSFVSSMIRDANKNALINETIISKEVHEINNT